MKRKVAARLITGSKLYGIDILGSDTDTVTIYYPTVREMLGMERFKRVGGDRSEYTLLDIVYLLLKGAPNIWELLFATPVETSPEWDFLCSARDALWTDRQASAVMGFIRGHMRDVERRKYDDEHWDTKKGANVLRWWYQLAEYLRKGTITYPFGKCCTDALLAIRNKEASYEQWRHACSFYKIMLSPVEGTFTVDQAKELMEVYLVELFRVVEGKQQ